MLAGVFLLGEGSAGSRWLSERRGGGKAGIFQRGERGRVQGWPGFSLLEESFEEREA